MMGVIQTDAYTRTGRRVVDMRQPRRAVAAESDPDRIFRIRVAHNTATPPVLTIQAYLPTATTTQGHLLYNRQPCAPRSPLEYNSDNDGWADTGLTLPTTGATVHVFAQVAVVASPTNADHTQAGFTDWTFATTGVEDGTDTKVGYGYIGSVTESGGAYIIRQHHTGQLRIDRDDGDSRVAELLPGAGQPLRKHYSIERMSGNAGAFQLWDFDAGADPLDINAADVIMRGRTGSIDVRYRSFSSFRSDLSIPTVPPTDQPWPTPPGYGDIVDAPPVDDPWPEAPAHADLTDVADQSVGDDHRGGRTAGTAISSKHPYIHAGGDATRNAVSDGMEIGDSSDNPSLAPGLRQAFDSTGQSVSLDWNVIGDAIDDVPTAGSATAADNATAINAILAVMRQYSMIAPSD